MLTCQQPCLRPDPRERSKLNLVVHRLGRELSYTDTLSDRGLETTDQGYVDLLLELVRQP
jgi:hypothetical protein